MIFRIEAYNGIYNTTDYELVADGEISTNTTSL